MSLILISDVSSVRTGSVSDRIQNHRQIETIFRRLAEWRNDPLSLAVLTRDLCFLFVAPARQKSRVKCFGEKVSDIYYFALSF